MLIDIETAPLTARTWGLFNQNISHKQVVAHDFMLCFAAKWYGQKGVQFYSLWDDGHEAMVEAAHKLLTEADAVIHFNGKRFDTPWLNREFWLLEMPPPAPYKQIDLYRTVKKNFRFQSNKLDAILEVKGLTTKLSHEGYGLWAKVLEGDAQAQRKMKRYNKTDVMVMEPLYESLLPWITDHPNMNLFGVDAGCTNCGSGDRTKQGYAYTSQGIFQRYQCRSCGTWYRDTRRIDGSSTTQEKF
jgi:hypothetical protein